MLGILNVGIWANELVYDISVENTNIVKNIIHLLQDAGFQPCITEKLAHMLDITLNVHFETITDLVDCSDCVITVGGDGTLLHIAPYAAKKGKPILGVNAGNLGYMTTISLVHDESDMIKLTEMILRLLNGQYSIQERMMLTEDSSNYDLHALNEVVITKLGRKELAFIDLYVNDELMDTYYCDGIIISTPTGSTAYNLSAGGPIVKTSLELILITPICSHNFFHKPVIVSATDTITLVNKGRHDKELVCAFDGREELIIQPGKGITLTKSAYKTRLMYIGEGHNFYAVLKDKMRLN